MVVKVSKPEINVREKLSELDKPSGAAGKAMLRAETPQEQFNLIGAGRKNLLINASFDVSQRGNYNVSASGSAASISSSTATYTVDRWYTYGNGIPVTASVQQVYLPTGEEVKSFKCIAAGSGSNTFLHPAQQIEPQFWMEGKTFALSTWVRTNIAGLKLRFCDTVSCFSVGDEIPSDGNWHYMTATATAGTNLNYSASCQFQAAFGIGSIDSDDYIEFAKPQLEVGSVATPFEYRHYPEELALCQRYFERYYPAGQMQIYNESSTSNHKWIRILHAIKRSPPSLAGSSGIINKGTNGLGTISTITRQGGSIHEMSIRVGMSQSGGTANAVYHFDPVAGSAYFDLDCEL